jgi:hypothetical protein
MTFLLGAILNLSFEPCYNLLSILLKGVVKMRKRNKPPIHIKEGTVFNLIDIYHLISTLNEVEYVYFVSGQEISRGKGWVVAISSTEEDAASFAIDNYLYLNPRSFDYATFTELKNGKTQIKLYSNDSELVIIPIESDNPSAVPPAVERLRRIQENLQFFPQFTDDD